MRGLFGLAAASIAAFVTGSLARPLIVHPGNATDIVITEDNTLNSTSRVQAAAGNNPLQVEIVNNFGANQMYLYITGQDSNGVACFVGPDGNFFYPNAGGSAIPVPVQGDFKTPLGGVGSTTTLTIPDFLISSRIWVAEGELQFYTLVNDLGKTAIVEPSVSNPQDPSASVKWGFVEFNWNDGTIYANISYVDWVGISMGMALTLGTGEVQTVRGLVEGAVQNICDDLNAQNAKDGAGWDQLCMTSNGAALRVLSPNLMIASNPTWQADYYSAYIDQVWAKYTNEDLTINTQTDAGNVACRVSGDQLMCAGDNRGYPKPTLADIYGCNSGPFTVIEGTDNGIHKAVVPRLCAAFNRSTLLQDGGNVQPGPAASTYYTADPTSHYARVVHNYEQDGIGYAFSYDDVNPEGENAAGTVAGPGPTLLRVTAGGWSD